MASGDLLVSTRYSPKPLLLLPFILKYIPLLNSINDFMKFISITSAWLLSIIILVAVEIPLDRKDESYRLSTMLRICGSSLNAESDRITKLLGDSSPDLSKSAAQLDIVHYRIWELGDWHDSLHDITVSKDGSFIVSRRGTLGAYAASILVKPTQDYPIKSVLDGLIQDPFPLPEKGPSEGSKNDALYIIERYSPESGYRWGVRTLYFTSKESMKDIIRLLDELGKMGWEVVGKNK